MVTNIKTKTSLEMGSLPNEKENFPTKEQKIQANT